MKGFLNIGLLLSKLLLAVLFSLLFFTSGAQWNVQTTPTTDHLYAIEFFNDHEGIAVGANGVIIRTTNSGLEWTSSSSGLTYSLTDISIINDSVAYVAGSQGTILKTTDKGVSWISLSAPSLIVLRGIHFFDEQKGFVCGQLETIAKSVDGGQNWNSNSYGGEWLRKFFFVSSSKGYCVGDFGKIYKTVDGGSVWYQLSSGTFENLTDVEFLGSQIGYVCGLNGTLLKTIDGGINWYSLTTGTFEDFNSVCFINESEGYVTGFNNLIMKTTDGGNNWSIETTIASSTCHNITMIDKDEGYICGDYGRVFYKNESANWSYTVTGTLHTISIPSTANVEVFGELINTQDIIGVFYKDGSSMQCGGYVSWQTGGVEVLAYGDDPLTPEKDGFDANEKMYWLIKDRGTGKDRRAAASYQAGVTSDNTWQVNASSGLDSLQVVGLSGTLNMDNSPIAFGRVLMYAEKNGQYTPSQMTVAENGLFYLEGFLPGDYLIHALPEEGLGVPVYFSDLVNWENAIHISVDNLTAGVSISIPSCQNNGSGTGLISGKVTVGTDPTYLDDFYTDDWELSANRSSSNPAVNIVVLLYNEQNTAIDFDLTDLNGWFKFDALADGSYFIKVEKPGLYSSPVEVSIDEVTQEINHLHFTLNNGVVSGIKEVDELDLIPGPNPTQGKISLLLPKDAVKYSINVFNTSGKNMKEIIGTDGQRTIELDLSPFANGIYFIIIQTEKNRFGYKIIKA